MPDAAELEARLWKELKSSPFVMLGLNGSPEAHGQPMTAFFDEDRGPLYFYTTNDNGLVAALTDTHDAIANYVGKGHDFFAAISGSLSIDRDRAKIDKFWNSHVEAWFEGGKSDPKLTLLRLDTTSAKLWIGGTTIGAALTRLFGRDPKQDYKDNMAEVAL